MVKNSYLTCRSHSLVRVFSFIPLFEGFSHGEILVRSVSIVRPAGLYV